jgi:DNA-binding transcriptional LysR family regulator
VELRSLQYFVTVAEELHFGRAAKRLYITQPGLSQGIKTLERRIGLPLFERNRQHVTLTHAGKALLPIAATLLAQATELDQLARDLATAQQSVP